MLQFGPSRGLVGDGLGRLLPSRRRHMQLIARVPTSTLASPPFVIRIRSLQVRLPDNSGLETGVLPRGVLLSEDVVVKEKKPAKKLFTSSGKNDQDCVLTTVTSFQVPQEGVHRHCMSITIGTGSALRFTLPLGGPQSHFPKTLCKHS